MNKFLNYTYNINFYVIYYALVTRKIQMRVNLDGFF